MPSRILRLWNANTSAWEEVGDSRLSTHLAAGDPHPQYLQKTLADAKGDLLAASAADTVGRLALGTNGQVLTADSTQTLGVKWAAAAGGGLDQATADTLYVNVTGDAMTGALTTTALTVGGAPAGPATRLYGTASPAYNPTSTVANIELGEQFRSPGAATMTQVRWFRAQAGAATPAAVRLWDTTSTGAPVYSLSPAELTPFADTAVGWKTTTLATPQGLVAGRNYVLSYGAPPSPNSYYHGSYTPVPDSPLVFVNHMRGSLGAYPSLTGFDGFGIDPVVGTPGTPVAQSGAVRLANGADGQVAWRNAANTADLALTVDGGNALTFGGAAVQTQTTSDARYLRLTGGTLTGNLGVGVAPTVPLTVLATTGNALEVKTGTAPGTTRLQVAQNGTTTITPDAGQVALNAQSTAGGALSLGAGLLGGASMRLASANHLEFDAGTGYVIPSSDNTKNLGGAGNRFIAVYAVNGTIQTSLAEAKTAITPLSPDDAMAAVRATTPVTFDYQPPERDAAWYELPDDPEQAEALLYQRLTAAPLEEGARHQAGVVLDSPAYPCDPMFACGAGQTSASNGVGILIGAIRQLDSRLTALGG